MQQGQVFAKGPSNWAYRYRLGGRDSKRVQRSGFPTEAAAEQALDRALERARQGQGLSRHPTLSELVEMYLAQHDTEPETIEKLRWLLSKATAAFGNTPISELQPAEIAAWRMTIPYGHRFEATQALRQTLGARRQLGNAQHQPGQAGRREPPTSAHRAATLRILGRAPRLAERLGPAPPARPLRGRDRAAGQANGSRSSSATSTAQQESSTSTAPTATAG